MTDASHFVSTLDELIAWERRYGRGVPPKVVPPQREPTQAERRALLQQRLNDELTLSGRLVTQLARVDRALAKCPEQDIWSLERTREREEAKVNMSFTMIGIYSDALDKFDADARAEAARFVASTPK